MRFIVHQASITQGYQKYGLIGVWSQMQRPWPAAGMPPLVSGDPYTRRQPSVNGSAVWVSALALIQPRRAAFARFLPSARDAAASNVYLAQ